MKVLKKQQ